MKRKKIKVLMKIIVIAFIIIFQSNSKAVEATEKNAQTMNNGAKYVYEEKEINGEKIKVITDVNFDYTSGIIGDIDGSGYVDVQDAVYMLTKAVANLLNNNLGITDDEKRYADVNGDGVLDINDAQCILIYYAKSAAGQKTTWDEIKKEQEETDSTGEESEGKNVIESMDNFLFIGDSRYKGIESKLEELGENVTAIGVGSSTPEKWIPVVKNGSGLVDAGSVGENVTLPDSVGGVSVMLGVNGVTNSNQTSDMEELLNALHERYPNVPIMVNSVYHLGTAYTFADKDTMNTAIDEFNQAMKEFCNKNSWAYYVDVTENLDDESGDLRSDFASDGLHISSQEGVTTLVDNIKNGILSTKVKNS